MEVEIGRFRKDVWAIYPRKNEPYLLNSEGKLSRHMDFGKKVWLSFGKKCGRMDIQMPLLYNTPQGSASLVFLSKDSVKDGRIGFMDAADDKTIPHDKSDVFYTRVSQSHLTSLDEVVARLTQHREVESIAILGSGANGMLNPASDYDVLVVFSEMPVPISLVLTTIAQRLAEVVFLSADTIEQWLTTETFDTEKSAGPMLRRLQKARIAFDRTGRITRLYEKALSNSWKEEHNQQEMWEAWFNCNYDLQHTKRLLTSIDPFYLMAVDLRLLSGIYDLWKAYFLIRQLLWQGDKEAIRYLTSHDPDYLALLQQCLAETSRERKVQLYEKVAGLTFAPLGTLWSYDATAIELQTEGDIQPEVLQAAFAWWEDVISS